MELEELIKRNVQSDFEVLSESAYYNHKKLLLGEAFADSHRNSKIFRTDMDGCWEDDQKLCDIILEELCGENAELRQDRSNLFEIYEKPLEEQEPELLNIYQQCFLSGDQIFQANRRAAYRFVFGQNASECVERLIGSGYRFLVYSGSFSWLIYKKGGIEIARYPLALQTVWRPMGIPNKQIHGSEIICNEKGVVTDLNLLIEERKGKTIEKELYEPWMYGIVMTDRIASDASMVEGMMRCGLDLKPIVPVALVVEEFKKEGLPSGLMVYCPEGKRDKMEIFNRVMKIERALVEYLGSTREQREIARNLQEEVKWAYANLSDESVFFVFVDKVFSYLDSQTMRFRNGESSLFPERQTKIRELLQSIGNVCLAEKAQLSKDVYEKLKRYSPGF